ncbi:MAG: DUF4126 domain-containing protein [Anaerolineae bacterium]|uniref:DUF4126 domain-containing protein n=1 Tax=Promineifilum sp. TaxID=2664178 RepID=UPI001D40F580|nr:DUF4126 domain-containing protein [Anaerolineales bacterium]MCO5178714.1 DUF4126 domain-containing protein [Promineifilum sp.]MCW5846941.1 DUF4126 domain-containing protein [Anaerolineae bacterium]
MIEAITGLSTAFGLSGSAGLNAYIPLLLVALAARFPMGDPLVKLQPPYDLMGSWWAIGLLAILLVVEIVADKIPAVDTVNDGIQTFVRPAAGAILFAGSANVITDIHPILALGAGLLVAGGVHATKTAARPVVTVTTAGVGNPIVSTLEDIVALVVSVLALVLPIIAALLLFGFLVFLAVMLRRWRRRRMVV